MNKELLYSYSKIALVIILVIGVGLFSIRQFFDWMYMGRMMTNPCQLCAEANPHMKDCFYGEEKEYVNLYADLDNINNNTKEIFIKPLS
jgi:hypothetical protein